MKKIPEFTINHAECIRHWRTKLNYTYRGVARLAWENFPELTDHPASGNGDQISGMQLCKLSKNLLKDTDSDWA